MPRSDVSSDSPRRKKPKLEGWASKESSNDDSDDCQVLDSDDCQVLWCSGSASASSGSPNPPVPLRDPTTPVTGLSDRMINVLRQFTVPQVVFDIFAIMFQSTIFSNIRDVDALEFFAGASAVTKNLALKGLLAINYDIGIGGSSMDWNSGEGYVTALQLWRRLVSRGLLWLGTVCSTWIFLSRWSTHRTTGNAIGDTSSAFVREGNRQTARSALMMVLALANDFCFVLEQPLTSMMMKFPPMLHVAKMCRQYGYVMHKIETYMKVFGHAENKGTLLFSNELWTHGLIREKPGRGEPSQLTKKVPPEE